MKNPKPGEVYKVDLGYEGKVRLMVVVSRFDQDAPRALVLAVPITSQFRESEYEVELGKYKFLTKKSYVNVQGLQSLAYSELHSYIGRVEQRVLDEIKMTLRYILDLE